MGRRGDLDRERKMGRWWEGGELGLGSKRERGEVEGFLFLNHFKL
jgi:hypothetical protein